MIALDAGDGGRDDAPRMTWSREQLLEIVGQSPARVAAHDREGWLALFARDGVVEDPVGAAPHPRAALGRFYDTFIAGNAIRFEVLEDFTAGDEVARDVVIHTTLSTGLEIEVPAFLLYEVVEEDGAPRLRRMRAVWDLRKRSVGALASGPRGLWTLGAVSFTMLRAQGLSGVLGYSRGLVSGIFGRGPAAAERLAAAISSGELEAAEALFVPETWVEFPVGVRLPVRDWLVLLAGARTRVSAATPAGWMTALRFEVEGGAGGVAFLEFAPKTGKIAAARFFARDVPQSR